MAALILSHTSVKRLVLTAFCLLIPLLATGFGADPGEQKAKVTREAFIEDMGGQHIATTRPGDILIILRETDDAFYVEVPNRPDAWGYISKDFVRLLDAQDPGEPVTMENPAPPDRRPSPPPPPQKSWWGRNWGWVAGGAAVAAGSAIALAAGGGGGDDDDSGGGSTPTADSSSGTSSGGGSSGGTSDSNSSSASVEGKWVSYDFGVDTFNFRSGGAVTGTNHKGYPGSGSWSISGSQIRFSMTFRRPDGSSYRTSFSGSVNGTSMSLRWSDAGGLSGSISLRKQ